jgi:hypothetical protein
VKDLASKETTRILKTLVKDKKTIFTYAKTVIVINAEEGLSIFTDNESISQIATEDDILAYLETLEAFQPLARERYLEYLINKNDNQDRFQTLLGLLYIGRLKEIKNKSKDKQPTQAELTSISQNKSNLNRLLRAYNKYDAQALLDEMKGLDLFDEEIYLYSKQKRHKEALASLVRMGTPKIDFTQAEKYCAENNEPLFGQLFESIVKIYLELKAKLVAMTKDKDPTLYLAKPDYIELRKKVDGFESYCKSFMKKYATNEKMDAVEVLNSIPEEWKLKEIKEFREERDGREVKEMREDDALLQYLTLTINDRSAKEINSKIAKNATEMRMLDLESTLFNLQKAYVVLNTDNICRVCRKKLTGGKAFYVFPNGTVTHSNCAKDTKICPVKKVNFTKKVYQ